MFRRCANPTWMVSLTMNYIIQIPFSIDVNWKELYLLAIDDMIKGFIFELFDNCALLYHDPDAPIPHGWYHWFMINFPKNVNQIPEGRKIEGSKELITNFPYAGYGGPAPPVGHGKHRWIVKA